MRRLVSTVVSAFLVTALVCPVGRAAPSVSAASAILIEAGSGRVLYEKNVQERRLIASTTKLMTALVAVESTPDLDKTVKIQAEDWAEGSSMYLRPGEERTLKELLYGLLLSSGNDAARALARACAGDVETFVGWMNERAGDLNMRQTHFANPNGLDDPEHYSTAADMALLAQAVLKNETLKEIVETKSITVAGRSMINHNKLLWRYEGCCGMKTGYTHAAGRTLVSCAEREGETLICVTLKDPNDWLDHATLFDYGFENWRTYALARAGKTFRTLPVTGSILPQAAVEMAADVFYPLKEEESVQVRISLPDQLKAPIQKGAIVGKLVFHNGETIFGETYLLCASDLPENRTRPSLLEQFSAFLNRDEPTALALTPVEPDNKSHDPYHGNDHG